VHVKLGVPWRPDQRGVDASFRCRGLWWRSGVRVKNKMEEALRFTTTESPALVFA
jgi:hypothetical protein